MPTYAAYKLPTPDVMAQSLALKLPGFGTAQWLEQVPSTNASLMALAREQGVRVPWPALVGAHHQTEGKGRLGRRWLDMPGQALMFSVGFKLSAPQSPISLQGVGPAIGMASTLALRPFLSAPQALTTKWPNDLMLGHGKCAGILIEMVSKPQARFVVIGMGLNLSGHQQLKGELNREVADLAQQLFQGTDCSELVAALALAWQATLHDANEHGFAHCQATYATVDYLSGQEVNIIEQGRTIATGPAAGLAKDGSLQIQTNKGIETFIAGDVSVRLKTRHLSQKSES